jgi:putative nucleotidyltransferase with HDIG domain
MDKSRVIFDLVIEDWIGSPPPVYHKLHQAMQSPDASYGDFSDIISADPSLVARLLRIANSPFYGQDSKVETIVHAVEVVGIGHLTELALATIMVNKFKGIDKDLVNMQSFWMHSIGCGLAARAIAKNMGEQHVESYYTASMLHDIGSLIIYKKIPEKAREILTRCKSEGLSLSAVETEILGFSHAEVGAAIFTKWGLPASLVEAVQYHHNPSEAKNHPVFPAIVHLADIIAYEMDLGTGGEPTIPVLDPAAIQRTGLTRSFLTDIQDSVRSQVDEAVSLFVD